MRQTSLIAGWLALAIAVLGSPALAATAGPERAPAVESAPATYVDITDGRLTVDLRDADLGDALSHIAEHAGFELRTTGLLGRVTVAFTAGSVEDGLRRLVQGHELMFVYRTSGSSRAIGGLAEVRVFGAVPSSAPVPAGSAGNASVLSTLAEIERLRMSRDPSAGTRLSEIVRSAPEAVVRARAVSALGRIGGAAAASALTSALGDAAPEVRAQAVYAVSRVDGAQALATLSRLLNGDPDVTVRRAAARTLGALPDSAATEALQSASGDSDPGVRQEASRALQRRARQAASGG